jgi:hypothetical protein
MNLDWTKSKQRIVKDLLYTTKYESGISTLYTDITDWVGIKLFTNKIDRDFAFCHQRFFHKQGIGGRFSLDNKGKIDAPISLRFYCASKIYGYITEKAKIVKITKKETDRILKTFEHHDISCLDVSPDHNVGRLRTNKPVCIDFDPKTMGEHNYEIPGM